MLEPFPLDVAIMGWVSDHRWWPFTLLSLLAWQLQVHGITLLIGTAFGFLVVARLRLWRIVPLALAATMLADMCADLLKRLFTRPRPPATEALVDLGAYSFPSTHAAATAGMVTVLLLAVPWQRWNSSRVHVRRAAEVIGAAFLLAVGAAMVYLGGHWVSDVLAGWVLGAAVGKGVVVVGHHIGLLPVQSWPPEPTEHDRWPTGAAQAQQASSRGEHHLVD